jgi:hypothetical protein
MRTTFSILFLTLWLGAVGVLAEDISCNRAEKPITIDGKADDWPSLAGKILKDQNAAVAVANDDKYIYCTFRTTDEKWVRAIAMAGMTLCLDIDGGKHKDFYLKFTGGPSIVQLRPRVDRQIESGDEGNYRGVQNEPRERPISDPKLVLYIKDRLAEKEIPLDGTQGPAAAFDTSLGFYTYEFRVPLEYGKPLNFGLGAKQDKKIGIGLIWGDMEGIMNDRRPDGDPGGGFGGRPGGDGGFPGGGMEPRGGHGDGPRGGKMRDNMPTKQEVWFRTRLAKVED